MLKTEKSILSKFYSENESICTDVVHYRIDGISTYQVNKYVGGTRKTIGHYTTEEKAESIAEDCVL